MTVPIRAIRWYRLQCYAWYRFSAIVRYSRDRRLFPLYPNSNIPCVVFYPIEGMEENPFKGKSIDELLRNEDANIWNFYRIAVPLPVLVNDK